MRLVCCRGRDTMESPGACCPCCAPPLLCLLFTLLFTTASTAILVAAIVTDHWEHVAWDRARLEAVATRLQRNATGPHWRIEWLLDGQVARLLRRRHPRLDPSSAGPALFLIPMNGGIWTLCSALTDEERGLLQRIGFTHRRCINYLSAELSRAPGHQDSRPDWQHRMQNLSISCALVCLIILGSSAVVGCFGVFAHQISAVLVTGVMYLLAATFALFTLTIIHFKRAQTNSLVSPQHLQTDGVLPSVERLRAQPPAALWSELMSARIFETAWSLQLGWGGVLATMLTAALWLMLSKIMRYSPFNT